MYQCPKCKGWIAPHDDTYSHACSGTLAKMRDKVAEHKALQDDPDYQLAKAAFTVLIVLNAKAGDSAWHRAQRNLYRVADTNLYQYRKAYNDVSNLTPRRRWQDKEKAK